MTHIVSETGSAVRAISASSLLSQIAADSGNAHSDSAKWIPNVITGHRVYNFEVENTHTYIADGIRVHNKSILSFIHPSEYKNVEWDTLRDKDPDIPGYDYVELNSRDANGNLISTATYKVDSSRGQYSAEVYSTMTDAQGRLVMIKYLVDESGNYTQEPTVLTGAQTGENIGKLLTPFLTKAIIGEDASPFEQIAANTVLGTFLSNTLEFAGGYLHGKIVSNGKRNNSLENIFESTWEDLKVDASGMAISSTQGVLNNLIMAEIFGEAFSDGVPGAAAQALTGYTINLATTWTLNEVLEIFQISPEAVGYNASILDNPFSINNIGLALVDPIMGEIMGTPETELGQVSQSMTSLAMNQLISSGGAALPAAIATYFVGNIVGKIVESSSLNRAWAKTAYDPETDSFEITDTWANKILGFSAGSTKNAKALANSYIDMLEGNLAEFKSIQNNYSSLGRWEFGNKGKDLRATHADFNGGRLSDRKAEVLLKEALLWDLAKLELDDGALVYETAVKEMGLKSRFFKENKSDLYNEYIYRKAITSDYLMYLENQEVIDLLILNDPSSSFAAGWLATFLAAEEIGITKGMHVNLTYGPDRQVFTSSGDDTLTGQYTSGDHLIRTYDGDDYVSIGRGSDSVFGGGGADTLYGGYGNDFIDGGTGDDTIGGGNGSDRITGGAGHDRLSGGNGKDFFIYHGQPGHDEIADFSVAQKDQIYFKAEGVSELTTVYVYDDKNDALIYIDEDTTIRLWGVSTAQLDRSSFTTQWHWDGKDMLQRWDP